MRVTTVREAELEAENAELRQQIAELRVRADLHPPAGWRKEPPPMIDVRPHMVDMRMFVNWDVSREGDCWHCMGRAYYNKPPGVFQISRFTDSPELIGARDALEYLGLVHQEAVREIARHAGKARRIDSGLE